MILDAVTVTVTVCFDVGWATFTKTDNLSRHIVL